MPILYLRMSSKVLDVFGLYYLSSFKHRNKNGPDVLFLYFLSFEEKVSPYITSNIYVIACLEQFIFYVLPSEDKSSL